ncbi:uncharacterized protein LOC105701339 [Orussus abietinus]|uniref:uncharacterized protein LOC105701339 n=1 Tax=Orussus abietinus TaxID=222816 RepID=UPI000626B4FC|nr:uncharacterized protein LOC105701339 [Orussus abietinus]
MKYCVILYFSAILTSYCGSTPDDDDTPWVWESNQENGLPKPATSTMTTKLEGTTATVSPTTESSVDTPRTCPQCLITPEYNPVCGTNKVTYNNPNALKCAKFCGQDVDLLFYGACLPLA